MCTINPNEVVTRLKNNWNIDVTRRTVLQYETDGRVSKPWLETGKSKEYHDDIVAEFVASWILNHGEYGVRPSKVAEVRKESLLLIYNFSKYWEKYNNSKLIEYVNSDEVENGSHFEYPCDYFVFLWLMIYRKALSGDAGWQFDVFQIIQSGEVSSVVGEKVCVQYEVQANGVSLKENEGTADWFDEMPGGCMDDGGGIRVVIRTEKPKEVIFDFLNPKAFHFKFTRPQTI